MKTTVWDNLKTQRITGIGSLPHSNIDSALEFSMRLGIPYLPQIPIRNPWEYMIPQALEGLPGLRLSEGGTAILQREVWESQSHLLDRKLDQAFASENFDLFEPSAPTSSSWQPFLWELQEQGQSLAKIQLSGPFTSAWALQIHGSTDRSIFQEVSGQIYRLTLARSLAMVRRLVSFNITPLFYLDEPGLYAFSKSQPRHLQAYSELRLLVQSLKKAGAIVGIHCCGDTEWSAWVDLGVDLLSIDTSLSLQRALDPVHQPSIESWLKAGGRFSLGVVPTSRQTEPLKPKASQLTQNLMQTLQTSWIGSQGLTERVLSEALFTPACGLALHSISEAEEILETLVEIYETLSPR